MHVLKRVITVLLLAGAVTATAEFKANDDGYLLVDYKTQSLHEKRFRAAGEAYKNGDYKTAAAEFHDLAENGDHRAMYALGSMYAAGQGVAQNYKLAMKWFQSAARYGRPDAEYKIGLLYLQGLGVEQNDRRALYWLGMSAKKGYAQAQYYVGKMHVEGAGVEQDQVEACAWLYLAEENGSADAAALLATLSQAVTPEQLQEARRRADDYGARYTPNRSN